MFTLRRTGIRATGNVARILKCLLVACAFPGAPAAAQEGDDPGLFTNRETLKVRIEAPLSTLVRERSDTEYLEGTFSYIDGSGDEQLLDLKLRARGVYRKQRSTCGLPPIRLNFKKKQVMGTEFAGQDKLKLVTHCFNNRDQFEQYVLKEYLAYRILNTLTDLSFRVRLLRVDYVDTERNGATDTGYGFIIEDEDLLAERIGGEAVKIPRISFNQLDPEYAALVFVFEYVIGNTDFSLVVGAKDRNCCHNTVLFGGVAEHYLAIPYDFDFSGLVNASYAEPNPDLSIRRVTQRLYRGVCAHNEHVDDAVAQFHDKREEIRELVNSLEGLDDRTRGRAEKFLDDFYKRTAEAKSVDRYMISKCL